MKMLKNSMILGITMGGFIACQNIKGDPSPTDSVNNTGTITVDTTGTSSNPSNTGSSTLQCGTTGSNASKGDSVCFTTQVLPFFVSNCATSGCHDTKTHADGYDLTSYTKIMKGITAGSPSKSKLYTVMLRTDNERMPPPPAQPLSKTQTDLIAKWITQGAREVNCAVVVDTQNVTFSKTIMPLLTTNCVGCHKTGNLSGGVSLENYTQVKSYVDSKRLWGSLNSLTGYSPMPPIGKLTDCQLTVVKKWIDAGAKND